MKLENVYEVVYCYPTNFGEVEESILFCDDSEEARAEYEKQLKDFKLKVIETDDIIRLIVKHNGNFLYGVENFEGTIKEIK